jgi:PAS domain S-box-containing protein
MAQDPVRVLLIDDERQAFEACRRHLAAVRNQEFELEWIDDFDRALEGAIGNRHDVYLVDYVMPGRDGVEFIRQALGGGCRGPLILLTSHESEALDLEAQKAGAADFLVKHQLRPVFLERTIRYALANERFERHQRILESVLESIADGVVMADANGKFLVFNSAARAIVGRGPSASAPAEWPQHYGLYRSDGVTPYPSEELPLARAIAGESSREVELWTRTRERPEGVCLSVNARPFRDESGSVAGGVVVFRDVTEQKKVADRLRQSEEMFSVAFHQSPNPLVIGELEDGRYIEVNEAFLRIVGKSREEVIGRLPLEMGLWRDSESRREMIAKLKREGSIRDYEFQHDSPTLGPRVALLSADIVEIDGRKCVLTTAYDVTDRKRSLQAIEDSERRYRGLVKSANDAIFVADADTGIILEANEKAGELMGAPPDELIGRHQSVLHPPEEAERYRVVFQSHVRQGGTVSTEEIDVMRRDGRRVPVEVSDSVIQQGDRRIIQGIFRDITERKLAEEQRERLQAQLAKERDDMRSILNRLDAGIAMTDERGRVIFLNRACLQIVGRSEAEAIHRPWSEVCPFEDDYVRMIQEVAERPPERRGKIAAPLQTGDGRLLWLEVDVHDDPRNPARKIFFAYDLTESHHLRLMLKQKGELGDLIGRTPAMRQIYDQIREVARVDSIVLIEGETGTGKELVARAIHNGSHRSKAPFIAVNCGGLTESLLASQLFGHKRGSFTGAVENHRGHFEEAQGGTIFLDEIGDIPNSVQLNLLRVLQEREIVRLGESRARKIDVRIICATNRNLAEEVETGRFRQDLLYRIRVARVHLPPLRERREDIPLLAEVFLDKFRASGGKKIAAIGPEAMRALMVHRWPGNVRELQSAVEFAAIRAKSETIQAEDLPPEIQGSELYLPPASKGDGDDAREAILTALRQAGGNRTVAARLLGVGRATLYRRMDQLNIRLKK